MAINNYLLALGIHWPNCQCYATGNNYSDITWVAGDALPSQAVLDNWLAAPTADYYQAIGALSAGGLSGDLQVNSAGQLAGAAYLGYDSASGALVMDPNALAIAAPTDALFQFCRVLAGRRLASFLGPSNLESQYQPSMWGSKILQWLPSTGTTLSLAYGDTWTARNSGSNAAQSHPTRSTANLLSSVRRANFSTGTTSSGTSGVQSTNIAAFRGNAAGIGGFFYHSRFGVEAYLNTLRIFNGLSANNAVLAAQPSALANTIGIGKDSGDTTWQLISNNGTTATKLNTGVTIAAGDLWDFFMFCKPNDSKVTARMVRVSDGLVALDNVDVTSTLPTNTVGLFAQAHIMSTSGSTAKLLALCNIYLESDN